MKRGSKLRSACCLMGLLCLMAVPVLNAGLISPGDDVIGIGGAGIWSKSISNLIDGDVGSPANDQTIWDGAPNAGFIVNPSGSGVVTGFELTTADVPEVRNPFGGWHLYGTDDTVVYGGENIASDTYNWTLIDQGPITDAVLPISPDWATASFSVSNTVEYVSYKMIFDTTRDGGNVMAIGEFQLVPEPATMLLISLGGLCVARRRRA